MENKQLNFEFLRESFDHLHCKMIFLLVLLSTPFVSSINNGTTIRPDNPFWNFVVQIHFNGIFRCGASAITNYFALTAAHCLVDPEATISNTKIVSDPFYVSVGLDFTSPDYIYGISKIIIHHQYSHQGEQRYDIGLIKVLRRLPSKMDLHKGWLPLPLGDLCLFAGWGSIGVDHNITSRVLSEMDTFVQRLDKDRVWTRDRGGLSLGGQVQASNFLKLCSKDLFFRVTLEVHFCVSFQDGQEINTT